MNNKSVEWQQTLGGVNPTFSEFSKRKGRSRFVSFGSFIGGKKRVVKEVLNTPIVVLNANKKQGWTEPESKLCVIGQTAAW